VDGGRPVLDLMVTEFEYSPARHLYNSFMTQGDNRFKVWKTKFWKRRHTYRDMKAELDATWPVITSHQLES